MTDRAGRLKAREAVQLARDAAARIDGTCSVVSSPVKVVPRRPSLTTWIVGAATVVAMIMCFCEPLARAADSKDADLIKRGEYLATAGDCVACHTAPGGKPFAGGLSLQTPFGAIRASNITPSITNGIGNYTLEQFTDALRKGIRADGKHLYPAMPYTSYALLSDSDVEALYAYFLKSVAPVDSAAPTTDLPFPFNVRLLMAAWNILFLDNKRFQPASAESAGWNRGAYLVRGLAHCGVCHTPRNIMMGERSSSALGGADLGTWYAPNITSDADSGIGGWSEHELVDYLQLGHATTKARAAGPMAEAIDYSLRRLTAKDLGAIATYLKTVPAVHDETDTRPAFAWGTQANDLSGIRGTPLPTDANAMSGPQLYGAYCATCHNAGGQGSADSALPSLFHNTALGRTNTNNLVMVILDGIRRQTDPPDVPMPAFANLSDHQIAVLGGYLMQKYGNPGAQVTDAQVRDLRSGALSSPLLIVAQISIAVAVIVLIGFLFLIVLRLRRRATA